MTTNRKTGVYCFELEKKGRLHMEKLGEPEFFPLHNNEIQIGIVFPKGRAKTGRLIVVVTDGINIKIKDTFKGYHTSNDKRDFLRRVGQGIADLYKLKGGWNAIHKKQVFTIIEWVNYADTSEDIRKQIKKEF